MMRITFVVPGLEISGGARIVAGHAQRLIAKGHEVLVIAPPPRRPSMRDRVATLFGRRHSSVPPEQSHYGLTLVPYRVTGAEGRVGADDVPDADVIIATWWETVEWVWTYPPEKGAKVHFIQGYDAFSDDLVDRVDAVWRLPMSKIAVAQWLIDLGRDRFGIEEMSLVPNSVDHDLFSWRPRPKCFPPRIGFLFHEAALKDMPTLLDALKSLKQKKPETEFLSFGAVAPRPGKLPDGTEFHQLPSQEQIANIYARCDAWVSTSQKEGFNLPPLEAMASGCPAVCTKTGRPLEIIKNGINGYLVDQGCVSQVATALERIISLSDQDWRAMSAAASRAVTHPTWAESSRLFEEALARSIDAASLE